MTPPVRTDHRVSFLKAAEVWAPAHDLDELVWVSGHYGDLDAFRDASTGHRFRYGRGLPGLAWERRRPIVMRTASDRFERRDVALELGLTCAIALPVFAGDFLTAVLVLLCGDDEEVGGAIEIWHRPDRRGGLRVLDGFYGRLQHFELASADREFASGVGLPGLVWASRRPVILSDLSASPRFVDHAVTGEVGVATGFGLPATDDPDDPQVLAFISTQDTPIARLIEVWGVANDGDLELLGGFASSGVDVMRRNDGSRIPQRSGLLGGAMFRGMPVVSSIVTGEVAMAMGCEAEVAIPIVRGGICRHVVLFAY